MMRFLRPAKPRDFDDHVAAARKHIADLVQSGTRPKSDDFKDRWGAFKPHFIGAQHRKCGFCESKVTNVDTGDVEHYRPKAGITALPAERARWGRELPDSGNAEGRDPDAVCEWGYHFLAYEWDNYLFACGRCNRAWKGNLFPVSTSVASPRPMEEGIVAEEPLLLNPYQGPDPTKHLRFMAEVPGQVGPRDDSPFGRATIDTCFLDRPSLVDARSEKAAEVLEHLKSLDDSLRAAQATSEPPLLKLRDLGSLGHAYAGLVRGTFEVWIGMTWEEAFGPDEIPSPSLQGQPTGSRP